MEIELTISPQYVLIGFDWYGADEKDNFNEVNIYFFLFKLSFYWV